MSDDSDDIAERLLQAASDPRCPSHMADVAREAAEWIGRVEKDNAKLLVALEKALQRKPAS